MFMHWLLVEAIWLAFSQETYLNFKWNNLILISTNMLGHRSNSYVHEILHLSTWVLDNN